jgi:putative NADH-flavin reductase
MKKKQVVLMGATTHLGQYILINSLLLGFEVIAITPLADKIRIKNKNLRVLESNLQNFETIRSIVNNSEVIINVERACIKQNKINLFI